jgi:hypothetical protein
MSATESTEHGPDADGGAEAELTTVVRDLADRIEALQADVRRLGGPGLPSAEPGWDDEDVPPAAAPSYAWVTSIGAPIRRRPGVPRLLLEVLFLAGVAMAAAVAKLDAAVIVGVMAAAWALVALIEWAASRAARRREAIPQFAPSAPIAPAVPLPADPSWFVPPVEHTLLEPAADSPTAITKLPPAAEIDVTVDRPPHS